MLTVNPFTLPLRDPFRISHASRTEQPTLIVELTDPKTGLSGLGEAPMTSYYGLDSEVCHHALLALKPLIDDFIAQLNSQDHLLVSDELSTMDDLKSTAAIAHNEPCYFASQNKKSSDLLLSSKLLTQKIESLHQLLDINNPVLHPFLRCALDVALHDLEAKKIGRRLNRCWNQPEPDKRIPTCYTIGLGSVEEMQAKIKNFPWPVYKIKLGTEDDVATIRALREVTDSPFRVDANTGWTAAQTLIYAPKLAELGVEFIEQPLKVDDLAGQRLLYKESPLPIVADESCQTLEDVDKCAGMFHGINVKVVKCGGLMKARKMIARARELMLSVMAGCMTESSVGISAIAQLVPELDYVDIDGALLLAEDPAEGVTFDQEGIVQYPDRPGTGAVLRG